MKTYSIVFLLLCGFGQMFGQLTLERQVVSSTGGDLVNGQLSASTTVGEAIVQTVSQGTLVLTQGFQQPDVDGSVGIDPELEAVLQYRAYPNPTADKVTLSLTHEEALSLQLLLYDNLGRLVLPSFSYHHTAGTHEETIDLSALATGVYRLAVQKSSGEILFSLNLEKM